VLESRVLRGAFGPGRKRMRGGQRKLQDVGPELLKLCKGHYEKDQKMWPFISVMFIVHVGSEKLYDV
jgi:hypothetical protein